MLRAMLHHFHCTVAAIVLALLAATVPRSALAVEAPSVLVIEVFVRDGCPHCADAKAWLPTWHQRHPDVQLVYRSIDHDRDARQALLDHARRAGIWPPGVPFFVVGDEALLGFVSADVTGPQLDAMVARAKAGRTLAGDQKHANDSTVPSAQSAADTGGVVSTWAGELSLDALGLPVFTLALGLLDGFNPCAMWVLLFLLSLLVHLNSRRDMALIAGTFVAVSGAVYYLFMAAWLNVFLLVGWSGPLQTGLGVVALLIGALNLKDFVRPGIGPTLSIPDRAKPGLYARMRAILTANNRLAALAGVALLAVVVNLIELLCTAGLPAIYTAVLAQQPISSTGYYSYLGLYIVGYVADDALMVGTAVLAFSSRKLTKTGGRWLKALSAAVMLLLGLLLLLRPDLLR